MTETINVTIRLDRKIKNDVEALFNDFGMNLSTAFNIFARQALRQRKIPFEIAADPFYSEVNMRRLKKSIADVKTGKTTLTEHELIEA
jgi:DNA-damage-inducible protein J